jgi:hypothetical protein
LVLSTDNLPVVRLGVDGMSPRSVCSTTSDPSLYQKGFLVGLCVSVKLYHVLCLFISISFSILWPLQEKVEEDRYMREQEKKFFERKKAERAEKMHEQEEAIFQETIAPAMAEAEQVLKKTGDKVSDAGLEALARWKLF